MTERAPLPDQHDSVSFDPTDPQIWGAMVDRMAEKMAERMWGTRLWYLGVANDALTAAFLHLDPKDTQRVLMLYLEPPETDHMPSEQLRGAVDALMHLRRWRDEYDHDEQHIMDAVALLEAAATEYENNERTADHG